MVILHGNFKVWRAIFHIIAVRNQLRRRIVNHNREGCGLLAFLAVNMAGYRIGILSVRQIVIITVVCQINRLPSL